MPISDAGKKSILLFRDLSGIEEHMDMKGVAGVRLGVWAPNELVELELRDVRLVRLSPKNAGK